MQVTVYNLREYDEREWFDYYSQELGIKLVTTKEAPSLENAELAKGSGCVDILTSLVDRNLLQKFADCGVHYLTTRTIGYDHIDLEAAKELGIHVGNAPYGADGVADYTLMLMLMSIRNAKRIMERTNIQDYTLRGLKGRELRDLTVGVIGTGRIGSAVIERLSGFHCRILAYDHGKVDPEKSGVEYVSLEEIWRQADLITLHTPITEENFHVINTKTIQEMKDGVILINTARGGLIDTQALIAAVENGKISAAGLDVIENEFDLYYYDHKADVLNNHELAILRAFPNVTITHHMAFYTDNYVKTVVKDSLHSCKLAMEGRENPWEVC